MCIDAKVIGRLTWLKVSMRTVLNVPRLFSRVRSCQSSRVKLLEAEVGVYD